MSNKASGQRAIKFDLFDEMDTIFGRQPNVQPLAVARTSRGINNMLATNQMKGQKEKMRAAKEHILLKTNRSI
ncbi:hypothetical protein ABEB36_015616 [Hypothenemus hampei]|uniref:Uncharacterized protein n=1 Tax=Hypothenemus hampei TaxID=57062 RepID=A0ABD1DZH4_HYPHA